MSETRNGTPVLPSIAALATRERSKALVRTAFPRRRARLQLVRTTGELERTLRSALVDAVLVDIGGAGDEAWKAATLAREFPSVPFFALSPMRAGDGPLVARCAELELADVLCDGVDDGALRDLVLPLGFSARFADALASPPPALGIRTPIQLAAWRHVVSHAGRTVRTDALAQALGVTREHLSRTFAADGAPNLKRVIDLVRLLAAAELAKNPGYDVGDVARVLDFASSSHLSSTAQRIVGTRPASLARLRAVDLIERFCHGRGRSRSSD